MPKIVSTSAVNAIHHALRETVTDACEFVRTLLKEQYPKDASVFEKEDFFGVQVDQLEGVDSLWSIFLPDSSGVPLYGMEIGVLPDEIVSFENREEVNQRICDWWDEMEVKYGEEETNEVAVICFAIALSAISFADMVWMIDKPVDEKDKDSIYFAVEFKGKNDYRFYLQLFSEPHWRSKDGIPLPSFRN